jgi:hypothetical protein
VRTTEHRGDGASDYASDQAGGGTDTGRYTERQGKGQRNDPDSDTCGRIPRP